MVLSGSDSCAWQQQSCKHEHVTIASLRLLTAMSRARGVAQAHMTKSERWGFSWAEETVTELLLVAASPEVRAVTFTKRQEGGHRGTGADWLWWWIGDNGESFGTLVQAKRLKKRSNGRWFIDFNYNSGQQQASLLATAKALNVAPTYALYFGPPFYRHPIPCDKHSHPANFAQCHRCIRKTVSLLPAILATPGGGVAYNPAEAYQLAVSLEDLVDPKTPIRTPQVALPLDIDSDLAGLLFGTQGGPRKVARVLLEQAIRTRFSQYRLASAEKLEATSEDFTFSSLPDDQGHMPEPYFRNILRGLRNTPPDYVLDILTADTGTIAIDVPSAFEGADVAGVVIVDMRVADRDT